MPIMVARFTVYHTSSINLFLADLCGIKEIIPAKSPFRRHYDSEESVTIVSETYTDG